MSASLDSSFSQVTFTDIQESYCNLKDLECHVSVSSALAPNCSDTVGVFKVGWKSTKEYVCSKTVNVQADFEPGTILTSTVVFAAAELPKDLHEFYQFCYVCHVDQRVRGISSPFQFVDDQSAIDWELVENEQQSSLPVAQSSQPEPSIVVIEQDSSFTEDEAKTNSAQYETQIEDLKKELLVVQQEMVSMSLDKEHSLSLQTTLDELNKRYLCSEAKCQEMQFTLDSKEAKLKCLEGQISDLRSQLDDALGKITESAESTREQHQKDVEEVTRQKSLADAEIESLKKMLQQNELELEASKEGSFAQLQDLQELLNAEREKNNELELQVRTLRDTKQHPAISSSIRLDSLKNSDGDNAAAKSLPAQCPVCSMVFPKEDPIQVNEAHVLAHLERVCPVCDEKFSPTDERDLIRHVEKCLVIHQQTTRQ